MLFPDKIFVFRTQIMISFLNICSFCYCFPEFFILYWNNCFLNMFSMFLRTKVCATVRKNARRQRAHSCAQLRTLSATLCKGTYAQRCATHVFPAFAHDEYAQRCATVRDAKFTHTLAYERSTSASNLIWCQFATFCLDWGPISCVLQRFWTNFQCSATIWGQFVAFCIDFVPIYLVSSASIWGPISSVLPRFGG